MEPQSGMSSVSPTYPASSQWTHTTRTPMVHRHFWRYLVLLIATLPMNTMGKTSPAPIPYTGVTGHAHTTVPATGTGNQTLTGQKRVVSPSPGCPASCICGGREVGLRPKAVICRYPFLHTGINLRPLDTTEVEILTIRCVSDLFISGIKVGFLRHLTSLHTLEIIGCRLPRLYAAMFVGLTNLTTLMVTKARLDDITEKAWLKNLPNLENLDLTKNNIRNITKNLFCDSQLRNINLTGNGLWNTSLLGFNIWDSSMPCIKDLVSIDLSYNFINSFDLELARNFPNLKGILLKFSRIKYIHPRVFFNLTTIKEIDLSGNSLTQIDKSTFYFHPELEILSLAHNKLTLIGVDLGVTFPLLKRINFRENYLRMISLKELQEYKSTLQYVEIASNYFVDIGPVLKNISVKSVEIMTISNTEIKHIPDGTFLEFSNLTKLYMVNNYLTVLSNGTFIGLSNLKLLTLRNNSIRQIFPNTFKHLPFLEVLNLQRNNLNGIPDAIFSLTHLQIIDLRDNYIKEINPEHLQLFMKPQVIRIDASRDRWIPDYMMTKSFGQYREMHHPFPMTENRAGPSNEDNDFGLTCYVKLKLYHNANQSKSRTDLHLLFLRGVTHLYIQFKGHQKPSAPIILIDLAFNKIKKVGGVKYDILHSLPTDNFEAKSFMHPQNKVTHLADGTYLRLDVLIQGELQCHCRMVHLKNLLSTAIMKNNVMIKELTKVTCVNDKIQEWMLDIGSGLNESLCITDEFCNSSTCYPCPLECTCLSDVRQHLSIVDCTKSEFDKLPQGIPEFVTHLNLGFNNFKYLPRHSFSNYTNLVTLNLSNNNLQYLETEVFQSLSHLEVLFLQHNKLHNLSPGIFSQLSSLHKLDLSFNNLGHIETTTFSKLTSVKELKLNGNLFSILNMNQFNFLPLVSIRLSGNPWSCECPEGLAFKYWLVSRPTLVRDIIKITCPVGNTYSSATLQIDKTPSNLDHMKPQNISIVNILEVNFTACEERLHGINSGIREKLIISTSSFATIYSILLIVLLVAINYYRKTLKVQLYSRCPSFIKRKLRPKTKGSCQGFDVFVAYSPDDWEIVTKEIVPGLRDSNHYLKVCVDYDNWLGGKFITNTVITCVENSWYTLLVVSNNFLQHRWCTFSFQMAQQQMLKDASHSLVVVLMPEVDPSKVSPDLRRHLKAGSCVKWGDTAFWRKIRYLIPHRNREPQAEPEIIKVPDGLM